MQHFLEKLSQHIIAKHTNELSRVHIVLPSRRAKVFLTDYLKNNIQQTTWLPEIYSLEDFVKNLSHLNILDNVDLVFKLYETHLKIEGNQAEKFEDFLSWSNILIQDFNEIDRYLVSASDLYSFLSEAKAIENWNLGQAELSDFQKNYLHFWQKLGDYYQDYTRHLLDEQTAYQGLAFRKLAEDLYKYKIDYPKDQILYFAGFNALTLAEEKIIDFFTKEHQAKIFWDADKYYLEDTNQEAGRFLRHHQGKYAPLNWISDELLVGEKEINIYSISGDIGQAKLIGELVDQKNKENKLDNTAVILGDEDLLSPVLESLPQKIDRLNVTMGYTLKHSIFYHFFEGLILLHFNKSKQSNQAFYFKELSRFLDQASIQLINKGFSQEAKKLQDKIQEKRLIYLTESELDVLDKQIGIRIFNLEKSNPTHFCEQMIALCQQIKSQSDKHLSVVEKEFLFGFYRAFNRIDALNEKYNTLKSFESLLQLFRQIISSESVAFVGEPLGGLQLMGVLESRTLDFEQVIFSSLNEGILPAGKSQNSFIPYDIKRKFDLPSYREKDAIFAYHFYRLIQRSKRIDLIYNSKVDQLKGGERSRFIDQLILEMPKKNPKVKINQLHLAPTIESEVAAEVSIPKNEHHLDKIKRHLSEGLSPSALNSFIQCSLNYYYKYILGMREEQLIEEKIEHHTFGTVIHDSLEALYKPFISQELNIQSIQEIKGRLADEVSKQYEKNLNIRPEKGSHRLAFEVAKKLVANTINIDEQAIQQGEKIQLIALEEKVAWSTQLKINDQFSLPLRIKGKIDRIDRRNNQLRIIDYKSGLVKYSDLSYKDLNDLSRGKKAIAIQMLIYQMVYEKTTSEKVEAGIISMRNIQSGFMRIKPKDNEDAENILKIVIQELLNPSIPFTHNEKSIYCAFC